MSPSEPDRSGKFPTFLRDLASIVIRPRLTMRRIVERGDRTFLPLVMLAAVAGILGDLNLPATWEGAGPFSPLLLLLVSVCAALLIALIAAGAFYLLSWIAYAVARLFEGKAGIEQVRSAMAWGLAPIVWSLLYRLPMMFSRVGRGEAFSKIEIDQGIVLDPGLLRQGCALALLVLTIELVIAVWYFFVASNTLAEVAGFSAWRGFGTLLVTYASPTLIVLAAALSMWL
ncbi:MAG TPA: YIP1 family protein [Thermoanaerobaculia bacterium]